MRPLVEASGGGAQWKVTFLTPSMTEWVKSCGGASGAEGGRERGENHHTHIPTCIYII